MSAFRVKAKREIRRKRLRRYLRGLAWGVGIGILLMVVVWNYFRDDIGSYTASVVRQQAAESLQGELDFERLYIDRLGRVVLTEVRVSDADGQDVIRAPRVVASVNPLVLFGRARRSIVLSVLNPEVVVVRRADGSINLSELAKPAPPTDREPWGYVVRVLGGTAHYTDHALLRQGYPRWPKLRGMLKDLFDELGYDADAFSAEQVPTDEVRDVLPELARFSETIGISGSFAYDAPRALLALDVSLARPGASEVYVEGQVAGDGREFKLEVGLYATELVSLEEYVHSLFPRLQLTESTAERTAAEPVLGGLLDSALLRLDKPEGKPVEVRLETQLSSARFNSELLPRLDFTQLAVDYDGPGAELRLDYDVHSAGLAASGTTGFDFTDDQIGGDLKLFVTDFADVYEALGISGPQLQGQLNAELALGGRLGLPNISGTARGSNLAAGGARLGNLVASGGFEDGELNIERLRLSGGSLPLSGQGNYDSETGDGRAQLTAGPLQVAAAVSLARALRIDLPPLIAGASGTLSTTADLRFTGHQIGGSATLASPSLVLAGQDLTNASARLQIERSLLRIQELRADVATGARFAQLGFRSEGPLRLALRASGTAQLPPARSPALDISGSLGTLNLEPEQALLSFELDGPLGAPRYQAELTTTGETPLTVNASGELATPMTVEAAIAWGQQTATFDGSVNLAQQSIAGTLAMTEIDLARVLPDSPLSGSLSLTADLSGPFSQLSATGSVSSPRIAGSFAGRDLAVTGLSLGYAVESATQLTITDGGFDFAGSRFTVAGTLGRVGQELVVSNESFNLAEVLAATAVEAPLSVAADGPLRAVFTGTLQRPAVDLTYASGPGSIEGRAFDNLELVLSADMQHVWLERLALSGLGGTAAASGTLELNGEQLGELRLGRYEFVADVESLQAALIAPLLGMPLLADTTGTLSGEARLAGTRSDWDLAGSVTLEDGTFHGIPFDSAHVAVATQDKAIVVTAAYLVAGDSRIVATGSVGPGRRQFDLQVGAESFNVALLRPFLPAQYSELDGRASFSLTLRPPDESGYPRIEAELNDVGGIVFAGVRLSEVVLDVSLREGVLLIDEARLVSHGSTLALSGRLSPALLTGPQVPARGGRRAARQQPLNLRLRTEGFRLGVIRALLPAAVREMLPQGTLSADLAVTGRVSDPQLRGSVDFSFTELPEALPVQLASLSGRVAFGDNNRFSIEQVQIGGGPAGVQQIEITGGGRLTLNPFSLTAGAISINLSPGGRYINVADVFGYTGPLGGTITVTPPGRGRSGLVIGGQLIVNQPEGEGTLALNIPDREGGAGPSNYSFDNFQVLVQPGTLVTFAVPLVQVTAEVSGTLAVNGRPGATARFGANGGVQPLSIDGRLDITQGNLFVYRHEVRLTGDENFIAFSGQPGDFFPRLTAEATLVLRDVLRGTETIEYQAGQQLIGPGQDDLTITIAFNNMRLGPGTSMDDMQITSEPPLPQEQLRAYLYGDFYDVLAGRGDLGQFAQRELLAYSTSFISRQIARGLDLEQFAFGGLGTDDNPFYISAEKELSPDVYLSYFRTFYTETQQREEFTLRYRFFHDRFNGASQTASVALSFVQSELQQDAVEVELQYNIRFGGKKPDPEKVAAAKEAAEAGQPLTPEQQRLIRDPDAPPAVPNPVAKPMAEPPPAESPDATAPAPAPAPQRDTPDGETENVATEVVVSPPPPAVASARQP